jgi:catechol-2,3-dioxygenase
MNTITTSSFTTNLPIKSTINSPKCVSFEHIVLCLNNFNSSITFYQKLLNNLGFTVILDKIDNNQRYVSFNNGFLDLGFIASEPDYSHKNFYMFQVGLSHLALRVDSIETLQECVDICNEFDLVIENAGDDKVHHLETFKTLRFHCPSKILVEIVCK